LEASRTGNPNAPNSHRVEDFTELLRRAQLPSPDLLGDPLKLDARQLKDLEQLNGLRDDIEHVKPLGWSLEVSGLPRICGAAAEALSQLYALPPIHNHLSEAELSEAKSAVDYIRGLDVRPAGPTGTTAW